MDNVIKKFLRYLVTGYLFERGNIIRKLSVSDYTCFKVEDNSKKNFRVAIYTVIFGRYDTIQSVCKSFEGVDFYIITDQLVDRSKGWIIKELPNTEEFNGLSNADKNRYCKMHPDILFPGYDYSLYIDGNISVVGNIEAIFYEMDQKDKVISMYRHSVRDCTYDEGRVVYALGKAPFIEIMKQLYKYKKEGFPKHYGLFENNIIARKHNDARCIAIMSTWWQEYITGCKRDQLSFMYSLWKCGYNADSVLKLGNNSRNNQMFKIISHIE